MDASQLYIKQQIEQSLRALAQDSDLFKVAPTFFQALGYRSERIGPESSTPEEFLKQYPPPHSLKRKERTQAEKFLIKKVQAVKILFQITDEEITNTAQASLLKPKEFEKGRAESFLFVATDLRNTSYSRSEYAQMTREISKGFLMPVFVLFRRGNLISLAFADRRPSRKVGEEERDVLEKVSLLQQINCLEPHAGHLNILAALSLDKRIKWIKDYKAKKSFDGLHKALSEELNTRALSKRFYKDLSNWFDWAKKEAKFPLAKDADPENHLIRLITRMLFVWFIKEKSLVSEELFAEALMSDLLKNFGDDNGNYYRAILQNLFFATLNTEINNRAFSSRKSKTHRSFNLYRYADLIRDQKIFLSLMKKTPFINGGLFDCLDSEKSTSAGGYRVDCFTDNETHRKDLRVPDKLFFDQQRGLLPLFRRYKFTVEESTPIEQEVALDPELLGKVFENLLAAYNPETRETVRKQTGSYYTPRVVVDYMVDESLFSYLGSNVTPNDGDSKYWQERLRYLLDYAAAFDDAAELFDLQERKDLVQAIADIRVLDPAVGSGAFPMGMLHKLVLILSRLDKTNSLWQKVQSERKAQVAEIQDTFTRYPWDFGRKLFLIQNSIFGVDIQPVACQIAKLRFFISLAIEQQTNDDSEDNYGIRPLPNLETRLVAANTLLDIAPKGQTRILVSPEVTKIEEELGSIREKHFNASTRNKKLRLTDQFKEKQNALSDELKKLGFEDGAANKIATWNPFDQNSKADWFDPEWMFGEKDGFDIVIGNPPYVRQERILPAEKKELLNTYKEGAVAKSDLYIYFYLRGLDLLKQGGVKIFICSNSWLDVGYGESLRGHLLKNDHLEKVYHSEIERQFGNAAINTIISVISKRKDVQSTDEMRFITFSSPIEEITRGEGTQRNIVKTRAELSAGEKWGGLYLRAPDIYHYLMKKHADKFVRLGNVSTVKFGIKTGANEFFYLDDKRAKEWGIEQEFLSPVIKSPKECRSMVIDSKKLKYRIFMCHLSKKDLVSTAALEYIKWGEKQGFDQRPSCKNRPRWWDLGMHDIAPITSPSSINEVYRVFLNGRVSCDKRMYDIYPNKGVNIHKLLTSTNCILSTMFLDVGTRTGLGEGLLDMTVYEVGNCMIVYPDLLSEAYTINRPIVKISQELKQEDRKELDGIIFDALNLTQCERGAVYEETLRLVEKRLKKAENAPVDN